MNEMIELLDKIAHGIGGDWKDLVLIDNTTDNPLVDAYNEGVRAMASQACSFVTAILNGKVIERDLQKDGCTVTIEKVGDQ